VSAARSFVTEEQPGDVLSPSSANTYTSCGAKYFFGRVLHLPDPPSGALILGNAVHTAIGENFAQKIETKRDLPPMGVRAIYLEARDKLAAGTAPNRGHASLPAEFRDDENPADLKAQGLALTLKYLDDACPSIEPAAVEYPVSGHIAGTAVRGYIDLLESNGRIRDLKTAARKPREVSPAFRFQVSTYAQLLAGIVTGEACVDVLVKTKTPQLVQLDPFKIDLSDMAETQAMYPLVQQSIRAGVFLPNRQSFMCSRKYCGHWRACERQFSGKVVE
jgi:hypothetical protein